MTYRSGNVVAVSDILIVNIMGVLLRLIVVVGQLYQLIHCAIFRFYAVLSSYSYSLVMYLLIISKVPT